ncbi:hypothetical protein PENFLA_c030G02982 [Penicillium flavigenum]|uniref:Uncharacterized protein n=1 Tax=Penicillium flavigenum TaxID=254877 RepID=A0A1V6SPY0_9EURO|nr:hypothetical protein PENFLA_c030G02982 [Penicillium flavigenum]
MPHHQILLSANALLPASSLACLLTPACLLMSATVMEENTRTWVIMEKLSERAVVMTETDVKMGRGPSITVGKFLCHLEGHPDLKAFMRIYHQIPIAGTEDADPDTLAQQAVPPKTCGELESFKLLKGCPAVPLFLGHAERTQGKHELLPGGFESFWGLNLSARDEIRSKFRAAYEQVISCGTRPGRSRISKIIFDRVTGNLYLSGFRGAWPILDEIKWTESCYVHFGLAKRSKGPEWYLHPEQWEW